ncbi:FecCD family ABC transporter permease [Candidatus Protofrankia californiensis]|uniref:FecCD family ABC transporter permease n=1 Tax=Candidatus Protofrankia californiensis TaxID=1839754 RepID=UPI001041906A|nr:iron chelate uptake ABC transporter family permease subunit [Candidatus Protofrankia californiensis]
MTPTATSTGTTRQVAVTRTRSRRAVGLLPVVLLLALVMVASVAVGARTISPGDVFRALIHSDGSDNAVVVRDLRVPRTLMGLTVGAALGLAGALMQALTRNALADPGLLGISAGATAAVVSGVGLLGRHSLMLSVWFAFLGAAAAASVVYVLGSREPGGASPVRVVLAGAAVTAVLNAYISARVLLDPQTLERYRHWSVGSLAGSTMETVVGIWPFLIAGVVLALALGGPLNALALGDDTGRTLGSRPGRTRALGMLAVTLLCGSATAAVGPIAFVGLAVPHVVRVITGPDHRWLLPYCMLVSPILLLGCDVLGRLIARPMELEVGIVTAFVGAPVFIFLVRRRKIVQL